MKAPREFRVLHISAVSLRTPSLLVHEGLNRTAGWNRYLSLPVTTLLIMVLIFPILRHKQFQDVVDGTLEDPLESLLGVVQPGDRLQPRILITVRAAGRVRRLWAKGG